MTATTGTIPKRRLDLERSTTALRAAHAILIDGAQPATAARAYAMTPDAMDALLADLAHDLIHVAARQ